MKDDVVNKIMSLGFQSDWPSMQQTILNHKHGPANLLNAAFTNLAKEKKDVIAAEAAIALFQIAAITVDDLLDQDTKGIYLEIGAGRAANLSVAFCNGSYRLIAESSLSYADKNLLTSEISTLYDTHARALEMESRCSSSEDIYWKVVFGKSGAVCSTALRLGAALAGASNEKILMLGEIGKNIGEIGQVCNDIKGAFMVPANADWKRTGSNLVILAGLNGKLRDELTSLTERIATGDETALLNAQKLLMEKGPFEYAAKAVTERLVKFAGVVKKLKEDGDTGLFEFFLKDLRQAREWLERRNITAPVEMLF